MSVLYKFNYSIKLIFFASLFIFNGLAAQITITDSLKEMNVNASNASINVPSPVNQGSNRRWIKAHIRYTADHETFYLECQSPNWKDILVLYKIDTLTHIYPVTGADYIFDSRSVMHKNFLFPLPQHHGDYEVWVGLNDPQINEFSIMIRSSKDLIKYSLAEYFLLGFYYGLLVLVALYNTMLYLRGKLILHLYYVGYIIGCICLSFKEDGIAYHFLWPNAPLFNYLLVTYLAKPLFLATFLFYASAFLNLPRLHRVAKPTMIAFLLIYIILYLSTKPYAYLHWIPECVFVGAFVTVYFSSLYLTIMGNTFAKYFFIGFSVVLASMLINLFRHLGWITPTVFTVYSYNYSIIAEVILFSWALAERIRLIQEEKKRNQEDLIVQLNKNEELQANLIEQLNEKRKLQDKVNRELEQKVKERTLELEEANEKLKSFASKMDQMNSALDIYNHQLKKEIKEEKISRVFHEELSFEAFCKIYPNEDTCVKEIYDMKWAKGYVCKKCDHDKFSSMGDYRRKCSKCGYIESATSHTLYHHLKFPLNKAFYITYVEVAGIHYTNEELATIIDLRKPTVWAFKQKVLTRSLDKKYKKAKSWKDMIMD